MRSIIIGTQNPVKILGKVSGRLEMFMKKVFGVCDWKTWKMKMVMEKSWNMKKWPKVMEFCDSVMEFYQFCPQFVRNLIFFCHH